MSASYKTYGDIYEILKGIDISHTKLAKQLGISRVTLYKSLNSFRDTGDCANKKSLLLFTELVKEQKNSIFFIESRIEKINSLFDNVNFTKQKIQPQTLELISETLVMLKCLLNNDQKNDNIDKALRFIARNYGRNYDGNIALDDVVGFQTITNKNTLNALLNRSEKLKKKIEERDYMQTLITKYKQTNLNYNRDKYKQGQLILGWIAELRETGCVIKFAGGNGFIETKYVLRSEYEGKLNVGQKVSVRVRTLGKKMIQFMQMEFI